MAAENPSASRPPYIHLLVLVLGEVMFGVLLFALFTFMPLGVQILLATVGWAIVVIDNFDLPKNKSLGSLLCGLTAVPTVLCSVAWRVTHQEVWSRLMLVGTCLMAALIFLDRRADWDC